MNEQLIVWSDYRIGIVNNDVDNAMYQSSCLRSQENYNYRYSFPVEYNHCYSKIADYEMCRVSELFNRVWLYNDCFSREKRRVPTIREQESFRETVLTLIQIDYLDDLLVAELYREIGCFEIANELIENTLPVVSGTAYIREKFKKAINTNDRCPFIMDVSLFRNHL